MSRNHSIECEKCNEDNHSVFGELEGANLKVINSNKICNVYKKGQTIFHEGNRPMGLYFIKKGKIILSKTGIKGREQIIRFAKEGDIIGYRALISGDNYAASAITLEDSSICFIPQDYFLLLLDQNKMLSLKIMRQLAKDLEIAELQLTDMAQKPVRERTAKVLLLLEAYYGYKDDGKTLNVTLKREEIANIVGTVTETLIRYLSEFKNENIVDLDGKEIRIFDRSKLLKIANNSG
ncbi:MAG: Crp/Fnr family transcriptional regulator [Candidatus Paceibacterota bacterium]